MAPLRVVFPFRHCNNIALTRSVSWNNLIVKYGYKNLNSDNGNGKPTSECGASYKPKKIPEIPSCNFFLVSQSYRSVEPIYKKEEILD